MSKAELLEAYNKFLQDVPRGERTPAMLIKAVAVADGVPAELFEIFLQCEHLYGSMCKTIWSARESWEEYIERVRVYDPTSASLKRIHFALVFGHGLSENDAKPESRRKVRPTPSQHNIIHGQGVPQRRCAMAGLRMLNASEGHLEHRHMLRKAFLNLNCLHQIARSMGKGKGKEQEQDKMTKDRIYRGHNLLLQQLLQASKMWFQAKEAFDKNAWQSRYRKQVSITHSPSNPNPNPNPSFTHTHTHTHTPPPFSFPCTAHVRDEGRGLFFMHFFLNASLLLCVLTVHM
jgi:hypothetical protein